MVVRGGGYHVVVIVRGGGCHVVVIVPGGGCHVMVVVVVKKNSLYTIYPHIPHMLSRN